MTGTATCLTLTLGNWLSKVTADPAPGCLHQPLGMEMYPSWPLANFSFLPDFEYMVSILLGLSNSDKWQQDSENPNYAHWPKCNGMEWRRDPSQRQAG